MSNLKCRWSRSRSSSSRDFPMRRAPMPFTTAAPSIERCPVNWILVWWVSRPALLKKSCFCPGSMQWVSYQIFSTHLFSWCNRDIFSRYHKKREPFAGGDKGLSKVLAGDRLGSERGSRVIPGSYTCFREASTRFGLVPGALDLHPVCVNINPVADLLQQAINGRDMAAPQV